MGRRVAEEKTDLEAETVVSLSDATKHLPRRRRGKRPHLATLYRWSTNGVRGVKLEVIRVGSTLCTSLEALQRFCDRCTTGDPDTPVATTKERKREIDRSEKELAEAGIA